MWIPPENADPVLFHAPTRKSVAVFGAVCPADGRKEIDAILRRRGCSRFLEVRLDSREIRLALTVSRNKTVLRAEARTGGGGPLDHEAGLPQETKPGRRTDSRDFPGDDGGCAHLADGPPVHGPPRNRPSADPPRRTMVADAYDGPDPGDVHRRGLVRIRTP